MQTVFLETNALNSCIDSSYSGKMLSEVLNERSLTPIISQHTTYELIRNFKTDTNKPIGIALFRLLDELKPIYTCQTTTLLMRELDTMLKGTACDYIIETSLLTPLKNAIHNLSLGNIDQDYVDFVTKIEQDIKDNKQWEHLFKCNKINNFDSFYELIIKDRANMAYFIGEICNIHLNSIQAESLSLHLNDYKVIKAAIRANLYMSYIARKHRTTPSKDKNDDFRHLIDASLCTYFVTDDTPLRKYVPIICPELKILSFKDIIN